MNYLCLNTYTNGITYKQYYIIESILICMCLVENGMFFFFYYLQVMGYNLRYNIV